jgi:hypothetical protein
MVHGSDSADSDELWSIGECGSCSLPDLIEGAYWHYSEWCGGQWSPEYAAQCAIGRVFSPGMSSVENDNPAYMALNEMAAEI